MKNHIFKTLRTIVRPLSEHDIAGFYNMQSNANVMKYIKPTMNLEESKRELERFINLAQRKNKLYKIWAIENVENQEFLGICGVYENNMEEVEIAYRFREEYWGQGYGSEIANALIKHCFQELKIKKIIAYVLPGNTSSIKILGNRMKYVGKAETKDGIEQKFELNREAYG